MKKEIENLIVLIELDYLKWNDKKSFKTYWTEAKKQEWLSKFSDSIRTEKGNKYIKIIVENSVWGFVVNTDDDKLFQKGDILKPAGWRGPARNKPRGNVFEMLKGKGIEWVKWTGPQYLK
tara:strand:+ start:999 stop:1358 length:360 start_codon:yes stop_codon:yes gene_type:complete